MLTAQQEAFAQHYATHRNGQAAYRAAYDVAESTKVSTLNEGASRLLNDRNVSARIQDLVNGITATAPVIMTLQQVAERWATMATADRNELIGLKVGACRRCWGEGGGYQWKEFEYWEALADAERRAAKDPSVLMPDIAGGFGYRKTRAPNPECSHCEGEGVHRVVPRDTSKLSAAGLSIYGGVKYGKNGPEIIIADQQKAFENFSRVMGAFKDNVRLDGSLTAMVAAVDMASKDPAEAARLYQEMCRAVAVNK